MKSGAWRIRLKFFQEPERSRKSEHDADELVNLVSCFLKPFFRLNPLLPFGSGRALGLGPA